MAAKQLASPIFPASLAKLSLLLVALSALYYPVVPPLMQEWAKNDNYSHGYFIPPLTLYMIYSLREELARIPSQPVIWGLIPLLGGCGLLLAGMIGSEFFLQRSSLIVILLGGSLFLWGTPLTSRLTPPICYLFFMIPLPAIIWNRIAFPMQLVASSLTEKVIGLCNIPIFREGNILHLTETTLEVVDACSGLRSLLTMFALSAAFAWFSPLSTLRKWVLFLCAAPVSIFNNIIRLTVTAIMAHNFGEEFAQGFLHDFSGMVTFILGFAMICFIYKLLTRSSVTPGPPGS